MQLSPYLSFDGRCAEAFKFYEETLGATTLVTMLYGGSPMGDEVPPELHDKVMHGRIKIGEQVVMASDAFPGRYEKPAGFSISIEIKDEAEAERVFAALADGGTVHMAIQETFWAKRFGVVTDKFATPWMIDCEKAA